MVIMINAANIKVGGGLQVAISTIQSMIYNSRGNDLYFAVSSQIYQQLKIPHHLKERFYIIDLKFNKPINFIKNLMLLYKIERKYNIELVFTIFGPCFWNPKKAKHLVGFANAWLVEPNNRAYTIYPFKKRIISKLKNLILGFLIFNKKNYYVTETDSVKKSFCDYFSCDTAIISVIGNCVSPFFEVDKLEKIECLKNINKVKLLTISHNYLHKNLGVITRLGELLHNDGIECIFVITFPEKEYENMPFNFKKYTYNLGPVNISDCPNIYHSCDALFLPTLIECFTVSYLEAFATNKKILTSELPFAKEICGKEAIYFNPYEIESIYNVVANFVREHSLGNVNIDYSYCCDRLKNFGSNEDRTDKYFKLMDEIIGK